MTREEAINWLKAISFVSDHHITEAIGMAIKSLSAETHEIHTKTHSVCSDIISRKDAITAIAIAALDDRDELEAIKAIPSAEHKNCWDCKHYEPKHDVCHAPELVKQVTGKLKNPCDSLLKSDSDECKEHQSKLESAEAESDDLIIKGAKRIKDGLYNIKDGKLFQYKPKGGTVRTYPIIKGGDK